MPDTKPKLLVLSMFSALNNPTKEGLKFVLFRIKARDYTKGYDYGFANWTGTVWEEVDQSATVFLWAELPSPQVLF